MVKALVLEEKMKLNMRDIAVEEPLGPTDVRIKLKTIGKMLDEKITPEGLFTIVLRTVVTDKDYFFSTRNNGHDTVKAPIGLFDSDRVPNDLAAVDAQISTYYELTGAQE